MFLRANIVVTLLVIAGTVAPALGTAERNNWDKFLWTPCYAPNEDDAQKAVQRILSNYKGPSLTAITDDCELAEFVRNSDGKITWIYHPNRLKTARLVTPEISRAIDEAIKKSSPFATCGFIPHATFALMYNPKRKGGVWLGGGDHPSEFVVHLSKPFLQTWDSDAWAEKNRQEILKHFEIPKTTSTDASAAYWLCLNPDASTEEMSAVPISSKGKSRSQTVALERALKEALQKSKLVYEGAPVVKNQPIGLVVYRDNKNNLHVFPHLADAKPEAAKWVEN